MGKPVRKTIRSWFKTLNGITLLEIMIAMTILAIATTFLLLFLSRASHTYIYGKGEQESLSRVKNHVAKILNEVRGAMQLVAYSSSPPGLPYIAYDYVVTSGAKQIWLTYDAAAKTITRTQYDINPSPPPELQNRIDELLLSDVDNISFYTYSPSILLVEYTISSNIPTRSPISTNSSLLQHSQLEHQKKINPEIVAGPSV